MHFTCTQENLAQGLTLVDHISNKNINLPVLGNVLLKTEAGALKLSTTNLELAISCVVRGRVEQEGEYSVPAKLLLDYVSLLPSGKVDLVLVDDGLEVKSEEQETIIKGLAASEFPVLPTVSSVAPYEFDAQSLRRAINQVVFAVSTSESRPELMGVACFFGANEVSFAATDSYRLAERVLAYSGARASSGQHLLPTKTCLEIVRILGTYKDELGLSQGVRLFFTQNQMMMSYGSAELVSRLIEGAFPDYQQLLPQAFKTEAIISRAELQKAVRTASLFSRQGLFDVNFLFEAEQHVCIIQSADQGTGKTKAVVKCAIVGESNTVVLNYRYMMDGLAAMNSEQVRIKQIDATNILLLVPEGATEKYQYAVMPIRQ